MKIFLQNIANTLLIFALMLGKSCYVLGIFILSFAKNILSRIIGLGRSVLQIKMRRKRS